MNNSNEYGVVYNEKITHTHINYPFCSFRFEDKIFISDALNNRVIIQNIENEDYYYIVIKKWFPRWIQPISIDSFVYVDPKKRSLGIVCNGKIIKECNVPMDEPLFVKYTAKKTFLVGGRGDVPLLEYNNKFEVIGSYLNSCFSLQSAEYYDSNHFLLCDIERHQILISDLKGNIIWSYGKYNYPGEEMYELSSPKYSCKFKQNILIVDGMNGRIISTNMKKEILFIYKMDENKQQLWWPTCVQEYNDKLLITDACNNRIIELTLYNMSTRQWGNAIANKFKLNNPRGMEIIDNKIYVADTYNHRIVSLDENFVNVENIYGGKRGNCESELFWPRSIRYNKEQYFIADGRNGRIVILDNNYSLVKSIYYYKILKQIFYFKDPHDVDVYEDKILVTDSANNRIIELDEKNNCTYLFGRNCGIKDPHQARRTKDKNFLIADTGNDRIIKIDKNNKIIFEIRNTSYGKLKLPRWVEEIDDYLLITDSGNNRILLSDFNGKIIKSFGEKWSLNSESIRVPRCARKKGKFIYISDTYNNRILRIPF